MNISELLSNPSMLHAAIVHMPIAASIIGFVFVILSAIFHRNNTVRALTALIFLVVAATAYVAIETGEHARELVPNNLSNDVWTPLDAHAESAERVLYASIFTLACLVISLVRFDALRIGALLLAAVGTIATNIFCANTGHLGGVLVYNHGVGTPLMHTLAQVLPAESVPGPVATPAAGGPVPAPLTTEPAPAAEPELVPINDFTPEEAALVSFKRDVWPIINEHCIDCHENPDAEGDYDMTTVENMLKPGKKAGPGIIPGKPDESSVIHYIRGLAKPQMPKKEPPLSPETLHTLRMWIAAGARDDSGEAAPAPEVTPAPGAVPEAVSEPNVTPAPEAAPVVEPAPAPEAAPAEAAPVEAIPESPAIESAPSATEVAPVEVPAAEPSAPAAEGPPVETPAAG